MPSTPAPAILPTISLASPPLPPASSHTMIHTYHCLCSTLLLASPYALRDLPCRRRGAADGARILPLPDIRAGEAEGEGEEEDDEEGQGGPRGGKEVRVDGNGRGDGENDEGEQEEEEEQEGGVTAPSKTSSPPPPPPKDQISKHESLPLLRPSLLTPNLRPSRKPLIVRREDGFEKRRLWRCARCGCCVGYEVELDGEGDGHPGREEGGSDGGLEGIRNGERETGGKGDEDGEGGGVYKGRVLFLLEGALVVTGRWDGEGDG